MSEGVQTCWNVCVCVCVGVSVGVVCQPLVEGTDGEDTARNAWGLSIQIQFSNAFFLEDDVFPKIRARTGVEREGPTHKTERGPRPHGTYTT